MKVSEILEEIVARQILDSRGVPTVEVEIHTKIGVFRDSCPSGASTGALEAKTLVDKEKKYSGKGVEKAIFNIKSIIEPKLTVLGVKASSQKEIDAFLCSIDGTKDKRRLGANAILPISLAFARIGAISKNLRLREHISEVSDRKMSLPIPFFNVINGGMHSGNELPFQELMVAFFYDSYSENLENACLFNQKLKETISKRYGRISTSVGDEGGFAPPVKKLEEAMDLLMETYAQGGFQKMRISIDCAANSFYVDGKYRIGEASMSGEELAEFYVDLAGRYPLLFSIEDPFAEDDHGSWKLLSGKLGGKIRIVGDDLTVTNKELLMKAIENKLCDTLLVKINQIGTVSEAIEAVNLAKSVGMHLMVSHRSGETEDTFICDFSAGIGAEYIKAGAPCRGERIAKYNQLLRIEEDFASPKMRNS